MFRLLCRNSHKSVEGRHGNKEKRSVLGENPLYVGWPMIVVYMRINKCNTAAQPLPGPYSSMEELSVTVALCRCTAVSVSTDLLW